MTNPISLYWIIFPWIWGNWKEIYFISLLSVCDRYFLCPLHLSMEVCFFYWLRGVLCILSVLAFWYTYYKHFHLSFKYLYLKRFALYVVKYIRFFKSFLVLVFGTGWFSWELLADYFFLSHWFIIFLLLSLNLVSHWSYSYIYIKIILSYYCSFVFNLF